MPHWNVNSFHIGVDNHLLYQIWENKNLCGTFQPFRLFRRQKYFGHICTLSVVNHQHLLTNSIAYSLHNAPFIHSSIHSYHWTSFLPTCWHILLLKTKTLARNSSSLNCQRTSFEKKPVRTDSRPNLEDFKIFTIQHEAFKKERNPLPFFQQNKHLTDHISGFPASLVGGFNHPTFTDICQIGSFPHVKVKHQKKTVKLPLSTLTPHLCQQSMAPCHLSLNPNNFTQTLLRDTHLHLSQDAGQRQI